MSLFHSAITGRGCVDSNRFDPGFGLIGRQRFQFGDLRIVKADRVAIIEVESGGGMTNLVKHWPLSEQSDRPIPHGVASSLAGLLESDRAGQFLTLTDCRY